jgi:hypothetical protein
MKKILLIALMSVCSVFAGNFRKSSDTTTVTDEVVMPREPSTVYYGSGYYVTHRCTNPNCREYRPTEVQRKITIRRYTIIKKKEQK